MKQTFYSNGKLLITGEYLVLDGAKAFALPTKFGQNLVIDSGINNEIQWKSYDADGSVWFENAIPFNEIITPTAHKAATVQSTLVTILHQAYLLNPNFIDEGTGYIVSTHLSFPRQWGLGTSSTLINNIAQWTKINAFTLLNASFGGSGYDIACAQNNTPIVYQLENGKPTIEHVSFNPAFIKNIYFVYLNKKQNSRTAISNYQNNKTANIATYLNQNNKITSALLVSHSIDSFITLINEHESRMSHILETETVQETLFPDFNGAIKSLGAWGGDFVLAISTDNPTAYFKSKGYDTIIPYTDMIL